MHAEFIRVGNQELNLGETPQLLPGKTCAEVVDSNTFKPFAIWMYLDPPWKP